MTEHHDVVRLILERLQAEGLHWYRSAKADDVALFERRISGSFSIFDGGEIHTVGRKPKGSFPAKKILVMPPAGREQEAILGLWLRWNFEVEPFEFRLFLGLWSEIGAQKTFIAYRFDAPEQGEEHKYYHCQPCRNFGDKEIVPHAALVSEHFPTVPINASNIVELTICALMSCMGHKRMKGFVQKLMRDSASASNAALVDAYARCFS